MSVLVECLGRYMTLLAESAKEFAEHSGRARITAFDVVDGLAELGIDLEDLSGWMAESGGVNAPEEGAGAEGAAGANRPSLPAWKGANPGTVIYGKPGDNKVLVLFMSILVTILCNNTNSDCMLLLDVLDNGRAKRSPEDESVYEWHALPQGFELPQTDDGQDAYAYPEGTDDDMAMDLTEELKGSNGHIGKSNSGKWIPGMKPDFIPEYMPPFPGAVALEEEPQIKSEDSKANTPSLTFKSQDMELIEGVSTTAGLDSTVPEMAGDATSKSASGVKLSINTSQVVPPGHSKAPEKSLSDGKVKPDVNPYKHVVPFNESDLPFSTLSIPILPPSSASSSADSHSRRRARAAGLSQDSQQLFSDTLMTFMDLTPIPAPSQRRLKRQSKLAHSIAKPGEESDTLFANSQQPGIIDSLLKQSAPPAIMNKFANPGVSIQDILTPVLPSERVMPVSDPVQNSPSTPSISRQGSLPASTGSRKGSFSNSPLSNMVYPPKETFSSSTLSAATASINKAKAGGPRKLSSAGTDAVPFTPAVPIYQPPPVVPAASPSTIASFPTPAAAAPINPSILSRIGSNFDPAALLAAQSPAPATTVAPAIATFPSFSNGLPSIQQPVVPIVLPQQRVVAVAPPVISPPTQPAGAFTNMNTGTPRPMAPSALPNLAPPRAAPTPLISPKVEAPAVSIMAPVPTSKPPAAAPVSLSDLPLSMSIGSASLSSSSANTLSSSKKATLTTTIPPGSTTQAPTAAPKIRFKFSALSSGNPGSDPDASNIGSSSSKHSHHRSSSTSSSHLLEDHRSSSVASSGSSHHHHNHKKSKKSSRDYEDEDQDDEEDQAREKKKKKKSKSKDRDKDRDRERDRDPDSDEDEGSGRKHKHKHHKHHKSHESSGGSNGHHGSSTVISSTVTPGHNYSVYGYQAAAEEPTEIIDCICSNPTLDDGLFMIACDKCEVWFHGRCVGVREGDAVNSWFCQRCTSAGHGR